MTRREERYKAQDKLAKKQYGEVYLRFKKLGVKMPQGKTTQFYDHDFLRMVQKMSKDKKFAESTSEELKKKAYDAKQEGKKNVRDAPTGNWVMGKIRKTSPNRIKRWSDDNVKYIASVAKKHGLVKRGCTIAADITNISHYGDHLRDEMRTSKPKSDTSKFYAHIAIHTVSKDYNVVLDAKVAPKGEKMHIMLLQMMKNLDRQGLRPGVLLVDRELFAAAAINALKNDHRDYLMPAVKNSRIKKAMKEVDSGERNAASLFFITDSKTKETASFNLLILEKENYPKDAPLADRYIAFATNLPIRTRKELVEILPEEYRKRWIVETGFRTIKSVLAKTCSRYMHVRLFLITFAFLLYGLWRLGQYYDLRYGNPAGGKKFTIALFVQCLSSTSMRLLQWEKERGNFKKNIKD